MVAEWDCVRKLNAFEEHYLAWILLLHDETLVQEAIYLASHFCYFSGIILGRNFCKVWSADSYSVIIPYVVHEVQVKLWCDHKFPEFYDLKSNKRYIFFMNPRTKLQFSSYEVSSYIYIHKFCACNIFIIFHVDICSLKQNKTFHRFFFFYQSVSLIWL